MLIIISLFKYVSEIICFLRASLSVNLTHVSSRGQKVLKEKGGEITMARRTYATCVTHQFGSVPISVD